jgi:hypothetical protein
MSHIIRYLLILIVSTLIPSGVSAQDAPTPDFSVWLECIKRGPYEGMAQAHVAYEYDGEFAVTPEDSRLLGDTMTGETVILNYPIEPGEHLKALVVNVGANKAVLLKIILFNNLHVVTIYDDDQIPDCAWEVEPEATPQEMSNT